MAGAAQGHWKLPAIRYRRAGAEQHVYGVEQVRGRVMDDAEAVLPEIAAPPGRVQQPYFRDRVAPCAMPGREQAVADIAGPSDSRPRRGGAASVALAEPAAPASAYRGKN